MRSRRHAGATIGLGIALSILVSGCAGAGDGAAQAGRAAPSADAAASVFPAASSVNPYVVADAGPEREEVASTPAQEASPSPAPSESAQKTEWTLDLYKHAGLRRQYPDQSACTAANVVTSLNLIALDGSGTRWAPTVSYQAMKMVLDYERAHMTLPASVRGSDPHGTRNALNYFGWATQEAGVYVDVALPSFAAAARAVVASVARTRKPAMIFSWFGTHAQIVTGYRVRGSDPATSDDFSIVGVYVTDPLEGKETIIYGGAPHTVYTAGDDTWVTLEAWRSGSDSVRFTAFWQSDSIFRDPLDGQIGKTEWYGKWVVVLANL